MERQPCVDLLASSRHGTLYVGVTSNLAGRLHQHATGATEGFANRYDVHRLVWYEPHDRMDTAIARDKAIEKWRRDLKADLIERDNPDWSDLGVPLGLVEPRIAGSMDSRLRGNDEERR